MKQTPTSRRVNEELREKIANVTVTDVEVSKDREVANVYVSADASRYDEVMEGLEAAKGRIRSLVGKSLGWRVTPELRFFIDPSVDAAERIASLFSDEG